MEPVRTFLCDYKLCKFCQTPIRKILPFSNTYFYSCYICNKCTKWDFNTQLSTAKKSIGIIEKLVVMFLDNQTIKDTSSILAYSFVNEYTNPKTIANYFHRFSAIIYNLVQEQMLTTLLSGEIELDETYLFKEKKSSAIHRPWALWDAKKK